MSDLSPEKTGIQAAVAAVGVDTSAPPPDTMPADQPDFFALSPIEDGDDARKKGISSRGDGKAGRPPGAKNKSTEAWRDYLLARYSSPLVFLAETYGRPVGDLARELGVTIGDAFRMQLAAAKELAPYVHSRMPIAVDAGPNGLVALNIQTVVQTQQNQGLTLLNSEMSDSEVLDKDAQTIEINQTNEGKQSDAQSDVFPSSGANEHD